MGGGGVPEAVRLRLASVRGRGQRSGAGLAADRRRPWAGHGRTRVPGHARRSGGSRSRARAHPARTLRYSGDFLARWRGKALSGRFRGAGPSPDQTPRLQQIGGAGEPVWTGWRWSTAVPALVLTGVAHAGTLATPLMFSGTEVTGFFCDAVNVAGSPIASVTVQVVASSDSTQPGSELTCDNLAPGDLCETGVFADPPSFFAGHCKVIFTGSRKSVRGSMVATGSGNNVRAQVAAE